jgi:hypothetical protein
MDAIPPRFEVPAEVRRVDDCTEEPCLKADHQHGATHQHKHLPDPPPAGDLPPGRQVFDVPQRARREQAEQRHRGVQIVQMLNRNAAAEELPPGQQHVVPLGRRTLVHATGMVTGPRTSRGESGG